MARTVSVPPHAVLPCASAPDHARAGASGLPGRIAGRPPDSRLIDPQRPWRRIRARADLENVRVHDPRHSFASHAGAGREPGHDRQAARPRPSPSHRPPSPPCPLLHPDHRRPHHRKHRQNLHGGAAQKPRASRNERPGAPPPRLRRRSGLPETVRSLTNDLRSKQAPAPSV